MTAIKSKRQTMALKHRELITEKLNKIDTALSEYSFANLYLFRDKHEYHLLEENNELFLTGVSYNGESFLMPLEDLNTCSDHYMATLKQLLQSGSYQCLFPIPEKWLSLFPEEDYRYESLEEDAEYIYKREKLAEYPGRKLSKKRNLVNQFLREYTPEIREINTNSQEETLHLLQLWQCRSGQEMGDSDYQACIDGLQLYRDLNLSGALYLANRKPCGFILGEYSGASSYLIHFAKGNTDVKGIYQYMFQSYVRQFCQDAEIINLEQDMGMEGLRKTKRSYQPDFMLRKYRIYPKD